jgi:hypothetical protein
VRFDSFEATCAGCSLALELPVALEAVTFSASRQVGEQQTQLRILEERELAGPRDGLKAAGRGSTRSFFEPLLAFRCGHVFHAQCVPHRACSVCFAQAFTSVYTPPAQMPV